jgi:hypothetical protein
LIEVVQSANFRLQKFGGKKWRENFGGKFLREKNWREKNLA